MWKAPNIKNFKVEGLPIYPWPSSKLHPVGGGVQPCGPVEDLCSASGGRSPFAPWRPATPRSPARFCPSAVHLLRVCVCGAPDGRRRLASTTRGRTRSSSAIDIAAPVVVIPTTRADRRRSAFAASDRRCAAPRAGQDRPWKGVGGN